MSNSFSSLCDDLYLDLYVNTKLELPRERDTVLAFFERIERQYDSMRHFVRRDNDECILEGDRRSGNYRWVGLESDRICSGVVNPVEFEDAYTQGRFVLELIPYMLSVSHLDIHSLDVSFLMDFDCRGSHDQVIAEALCGSSAFNSLLEIADGKVVDFSPEVVVSLSADGYTQGRLTVESKTTEIEPDKDKSRRDDAITLSFTVRQYQRPNAKFDSLASFGNQCRIAEEIMTEKILPNFVRPLVDVILQKRFSSN